MSPSRRVFFLLCSIVFTACGARTPLTSGGEGVPPGGGPGGTSSGESGSAGSTSGSSETGSGDSSGASAGSAISSGSTGSGDESGSGGGSGGAKDFVLCPPTPPTGNLPCDTPQMICEYALITGGCLEFRCVDGHWHGSPIDC